MKSYMTGEFKATENGGYWAYCGTDGLIANMTDAVLSVSANTTPTVDITKYMLEGSEGEKRLLIKVDHKGNFLKQTKAYKVTKFMIEFESED
jgi:hypothetical protein